MNMVLLELNESIWPTVIGEALVTGEKRFAWINIQNGGEMIEYISAIDTEKKYADVVDSIKEMIEINKLSETNDPEVAKRYIETISKDDMAYTRLRKIFKRKELQGYLKKSGTRKRNIFCWLAATLLMEYAAEGLL